MNDIYTNQRQRWVRREAMKERLRWHAIDAPAALLCCAILLGLYAAGALG